MNALAAPSGVSSAFEDIRADYNMSRESRFIRRRVGLPSQGGSADWHYRNEWAFYNDIEKARDMDRNDAIVGQTVDRAVSNIVQDGFTLDPDTGDKTVDAQLKARWQEWGDDPDQVDIEGESCWLDLERQTCRALFVDGDCGNAGLDSGHIQHFEAHNIQTPTRIPNTVLGVEKSSSGRREAYHIMRTPIDAYKSQISMADSARLTVRNAAGLRLFFHVYNPKRKSQTRGVTAFAPIFETTGMFEDINFAKMVQQQIVSCFAIFRERSIAPPPGSPSGYGNPTTETLTGGTRDIQNVAPGMEIDGAPGEKLHGFSPNTPNAEYFSHVRLMLQMIGVNLGLPLCLVLLDGAESTFHGYRGAIHEARKGFQDIQRNLVNRLHKPAYKFKVSQFIAEDRALRAASNRRDVNIFRHKWSMPTFSYIEPKTDAEADVIRLGNSLTSRRRLHAERNGDWDEIKTEIIEDNAAAITEAMAKADEINSQNDGADVDWRNLIAIPLPQGVQQSLQDPGIVEMNKAEAAATDE